MTKMLLMMMTLLLLLLILFVVVVAVCLPIPLGVSSCQMLWGLLSLNGAYLLFINRGQENQNLFAPHLT